ncbi:F-box protein KIB2-like [Cocos nucifera]|uniref:F-box protein KIB2-like n=1 Tax=Cocos nucifera TaxID=13894 RepID=A0A8K0IJZ0_COCNU|nr:F-box protein KIB2-like [Cocos nucifera]
MEGKPAKSFASSSRSLMTRPKTRLPTEILELIGRSGKSASAYLRFRATCKTLFSNLTPHPRHLPLQPPFLMLPPAGARGRRRFFNLATFFTHDLPEVSNMTRRKICFGSSFGWLILVDYSFNPSLLNPFTGAEIPLPRLADIPSFFNILPLDVPAPQLLALLSGFHTENIKEEEIADMIIHQAALSSDPALDPHAVVLIFIKTYAPYRCYYCQLGDAAWTWIEIPSNPIYFLYDFIPFPERQFYALVCDDRLVGFDFRSLPVRVTVGKLRSMPRCSTAYLVDSAGELLLISEDYRLSNLYDRIVRLFHVHKIDLDDAQGYVQVDPVNSIGDRVVFLGPGHSFSISAQDFPRFRGNCIYFPDSYNQQADKEYVRVDCVEVFSLEEYHTEDIFVFSEVGKIEMPRYKPRMPWLVSPNLSKGDA